MIHVQNREIVVPGQLIAEGDYKHLEGSYREGSKIYSAVVGLADVKGDRVRVIPLQGRYIPHVGDLVIGVVIDNHSSGWILDINSPYTANLFVSELVHRKVDLNKEDISKFLSIGDVVLASVKEVDEYMRVLLETPGRGMGKIKGGKLVEISPAKIPRVLGRKGSMLKVIESKTGCTLAVGQNGRIIIWGDDPEMVNLAVEAILMIEREAHTSGLTDRVSLMLEKERSGGI
ncbi:MAG: exosome complex RNA-binding protein Rrp4 [Candidatus Hadarchaeum sp.]